MNKLKNIVRIIVLSLICMLLGFRLYTWNASTLVGNAMPMPFGYGFAIVLSGSMEPALQVDDFLIVKQSDSYQVGDIVVFQSGYELIVHRIISMDEDNVTTQGDANNIADDPIPSKNIKGVVQTRIPKLGVAVNFLKKPIGVIMLLAAAFLLTELSFRKKKESAQKDLDAIKEEIRRLKDETTVTEDKGKG